MLQSIFAKFQALLIQPTILPYFVTFFPHKKASDSYVIRKSPERDPAAGQLPTPPESLWLGYGPTLDDFLNSGREHVETMRKVLADSGYTITAGNRVLELGCAGGRMLRWLSDVSSECEIWGTDISGDHIVWCKQHLAPPFHFFITTTAPHLPFADSYFDLIYAGSVFTHIDDLADAWMLELRRLLKPGGRLYITIHDNHTIEVLEKGQHDLSRTLDCRKEYFAKNDFSMFTIGRFMRSQVFYDADSFARQWQPLFDVAAVVPRAYGYQTAVLLQKRESP